MDLSEMWKERDAKSDMVRHHARSDLRTLHREGKRKERTDEVTIKIKESIIPPLYRSTDLLVCLMRKQGRFLNGNRPSRAKDCGSSETPDGKDSISLSPDRATDRARVSSSSFLSWQFQRRTRRVIRSEKSFRKWKRDITSAPILAIDDLFASKLTERVEESLFDILDERISWNRPTIVTTQVTKNEATHRFHSPQRHQAFFARIKEFFEVVPFLEPIQDKLKI